MCFHTQQLHLQLHGYVTSWLVMARHAQREKITLTTTLPKLLLRPLQPHVTHFPIICCVHNASPAIIRQLRIRLASFNTYLSLLYSCFSLWRGKCCKNAVRRIGGTKSQYWPWGTNIQHMPNHDSLFPRIAAAMA